MKQIFILARHIVKELIRKKDFYVLLFLFVGLTAFLYSETFFGVEGISRYLKDVGFSVILLFSMIIAITFSAKQVPGEIESKTIYPLLAKPVSRTQFILGKFLGSLYISVFTFTVFYFLYLAAIYSKGEAAGVMLVIQSYILSVSLLALISAISIFFSLFLTVSANVTVTFLLYFFIYGYNDKLRDILTSAPQKLFYLYGFLYYVLPHFEFYDMRIRLVHLWDPLPAWAFATIFIYTVLYISAILWGASFLFRKKGL